MSLLGVFSKVALEKDKIIEALGEDELETRLMDIIRFETKVNELNRWIRYNKKKGKID